MTDPSPGETSMTDIGPLSILPGETPEKVKKKHTITFYNLGVTLAFFHGRLAKDKPTYT